MEWIEKERLNDPMMWFMKAYAYASASSEIRRMCGKVLYIEENPELKINAIRAVPYLTGLASELFMKGYLVSKGVSKEEIKKLKHHLMEIREECLEFGDNRFCNDDLMFLTDKCGKLLTEDGGVRYPDKKDMVAFPEFEKALSILKEICGDLEKELLHS